jgi:CBS domain containing-hemolysin-like protein
LFEGYWLLAVSLGALFCGALSFFFAVSELVFTSLGEFGLKQLISSQPNKAEHLELFISRSNRVISLIAAGRLLFTSAFGGGLILISSSFESKFWIVSGLISLTLLVVVSAYLPACLYRLYPEKAAASLAFPIKIFYYAAYPLLAIFSIPKRFLTQSGEARSITEDDIAYLIDVSEEQGAIPDEKQQMLSSIFDISDSYVKTVMVPRMDMVAVPADITKEEFIRIFRQNGYSRIPVYDDSHDKIMGIIYVKDILKFDSDWSMSDLISEINPALFVPETKKIIDLLKEFQLSRQQMAVVVDEYGGVAGIVTMEDLLEEIVGEIWDEYDEEDAAQRDILPLGGGCYLIDARTNIEDLCKALEVEVSEDAEFDTVGGLIYSIAGAIPSEGDEYIWKNYTICIKKMEDNKILSVEFSHMQQEAEGEEERV